MRYSRIKIETTETISENTLRTVLRDNSAINSIESITETDYGYKCIVVAAPAAVNLTQIQDGIEEPIQSVWVRRHFADAGVSA